MRTGENVLFINPEDGQPQPENYEAVRRLLHDEREKRIRPHKDDKILTDWNGLIIYALARAAWMFDLPQYFEAASSAAAFITGEMLQPDGAILHSRRHGKSGTMGMIDDYAFLIRGLLELYRAGFDPSFIEQAVRLTAYTREHFEDEKQGGFYQSDILQTDLLIRKKAMPDNALPSGNSIMYENLIQLFKITGETVYRKSAEGILETVSDELTAYPAAHTMLLSSLDYSGTERREIVVVGETAAAANEMLNLINSSFLPGTVTVLKTPETAVALAEAAAYTANYSLPEGKKAAVYICTGFTCGSPVFTAEELKERLNQR